VKAGLLPWPSEAKQTVTLWRNDSGKFEDRWVYLKNESSRCIWTKGIDRIYVPVAHAEGKFMADEPVLDRIRREDLVVFKYVDERGEPAKGVYPISPNGSVDDIAGICDPTGRIFGLMPHPERNTLKHRDPRIRRKYHSLRAQEREGEGAAVLRNGVDYARQLI
jgi:phosphoribosylformylglycinamidine synthase